MLRKANLVAEYCYHIYNRGTDKRKLFLNTADYSRFLALLYICNNAEPVNIRNFFLQGRRLNDIFTAKRQETLVDIGAYCLMPNHFHILLKGKTDSGISSFLKKLCTAYAMYFNVKNGRNGNLFQGRFQAELANENEYLKYLFAYIHLNPVKLIEPDWKEEGIRNPGHAREFLKNYNWSSYPFYAGIKQKDPILNGKEFPEYFKDFNEFQIFINEWLNYNKGPSFV